MRLPVPPLGQHLMSFSIRLLEYNAFFFDLQYFFDFFINIFDFLQEL